ncbi:DUF2663 family protein [Bacillus kexueae]|uniref:DUF2663 family protein n=1 Tax=Aeribacillus kexueae TaxID=2078952 RepID=UPI001FAF4555|nr:DUF2663 family protein [Bacillus kexueae]
MDKEIEKLPFTDKPTKSMLFELVKRKRKYEAFKAKCLLWQVLTFILCGVFFVYLYTILYLPFNGQIAYMLKQFINDGRNGLFVLVIGASYATALYFKKKEDKKEKEFHALRCEIIDKSTDLWKSEEAWKERDQIFAFMKKKFDINLYFESK